jgi:hypothetical protein
MWFLDASYISHVCSRNVSFMFSTYVLNVPHVFFALLQYVSYVSCMFLDLHVLFFIAEAPCDCD